MNSQLISLTSFLIGLISSAATFADGPDLNTDFYVKQIQTSHESEALRAAITDCLKGELQTAIPVLESFIQSGDLDAQFVMAKLRMHGLGVEKSIQESNKTLRTNAYAGHVPSMVTLADQIRETDHSEALQMYSAAAQKEDIVAAIRLGDIYEVGGFGNVQVNSRLAIKFFEMAAKANNTYAMFRLANFHADGKGISPNDLVANQFFNAAAMRGHAASNTSMASRYLEGRGVQPDPVAAIGWLTRGAQAGDAEAMVLLAQRYESGDVVKQDLNIAGQLYSTAAKANDVTGKYHLARLYYHGIGTKPDIIRAFVLLNGAQALPKAKALFEEIAAKLTPEQKRFAAKKLEQSMNNSSSK